MAKSATYKSAGVDIRKADRLIDLIKRIAPSTHRAGNVGGIGSFAALFRAPRAGMKDPLLVSSTDGVGTKLLVANLQGRHDTIGIDLVAMSVNDIICCGAEPLFFLDYFATSGLELPVASAVLRGIVKGCAESNCALIGGETAEMPGLYKKGDYDLAGFCVGIVDRPKAITGEKVRPGDAVIGLFSSGLHSNGYSLARRVFTDKELKGDFGRTLLTPTKLYVKPMLELFKKGYARSVAHITGGGFTDNIPRVLPHGVGARITTGTWPVPPIFAEIQKRGRITDAEMHRTFNMGIGMTVITAPGDAPKALALLKRHKVRAAIIGRTVKGPREAVVVRA
ncbi:MAG: phosphoribosylformylglycinamidine cyclo-ligase [Fibrobacterota bacterium]